MNHAIIDSLNKFSDRAVMFFARCLFFERKKSGYITYEFTIRFHYAAA